MTRRCLSPALALTAALVALPAMAQTPEPGYFQVPGTDTRISLYGYAALDCALDLAGTLNYQGLSIFNDILNGPAGVQGAHDTDQWQMTAARSRFGFRSTTPTDIGDVKVRLECDFAGKNGGTNGQNSRQDLRVRHGYAELAGFLIGQTDSTYEDPAAMADTVDFNQPVGNWEALTRWTQVRYTFNPNQNVKVAFAIESPTTNYGSYYNDDKFPNNLVGALDYKDAWGHVGFRLAWQDYANFTAQNASATPPTPQIRYSTSAFSWVLSGNRFFGQDNLVANIGKGNGYYGTGFNQDGPVKNAAGNAYLGVVSPILGSVGYTHKWNDKWRSNQVYTEVSWSEDDSLGINGAKMHTIKQFFINSFYKPSKTTEIGVEYVWARSKNFSPNTVTLPDGSTTDGLYESRIQANFTAKLW